MKLRSVDASNADVASLLNAKVVLVANGGLGNTYDQLEMNRSFCQRSNVDIAGVVINQVNPEKYDQTIEYLRKAFLQKWGDVPLLGCIPDRPFLGCPALADLERLFDATAISGSQHRLRHYRIQDLMLVATRLDVFLTTLRQNRQDKKRTLYVCHASRNDILLGYLMESVQRNRQHQLKQQKGYKKLKFHVFQVVISRPRSPGPQSPPPHPSHRSTRARSRHCPAAPGSRSASAG